MRQALITLVLVWVVSVGAASVLLLDDNSRDQVEPYKNYPNLDRVEERLDELGIAFTHEHDNRQRYPGITENPAFLADYRVIVWYNDQRVITQDERDTVLDWVEDGNYLVVTGYDSIGNPNDPRMADLIGSSVYGDYPFCDGFCVSDSDNWIMDGPWGCFSGCFEILPHCTDHDWALPAPGTRKLASACSGTLIGPAKILLTEDVGNGGIIVYWNGNWDSEEWWWFNRSPETVNMFRNIMDHLVELVAVREVSWGEIKSYFTP
jgi:hypothetical protein